MSVKRWGKIQDTEHIWLLHILHRWLGPRSVKETQIEIKILEYKDPQKSKVASAVLKFKGVLDLTDLCEIHDRLWVVNLYDQHHSSYLDLPEKI